MTPDLLRIAELAAQHLRSIEPRFAFVGGLAVGARALPRVTKDVDLVVAVADDQRAEQVIRELSGAGYGIRAVLENTASGRLATVRTVSPVDATTPVDVLFASSGIEAEIVEDAEVVDIARGVLGPVACAGHLIATKVLAVTDRRPTDAQDLLALVAMAGSTEIERARRAVRLIIERGYARGKLLDAELEAWLVRAAAP